MTVSDNPRRLSSFLEQGSQTGHIARMLRQQRRLLKEVRALLPPPLARHCLHARISGDRLVIHVDSPVWSSNLRFHARTLVRQLGKQAPNLKRVSVRQLFPQGGGQATSAASEREVKRPLSESVADEELRRLLEERRSR